MLNYSPNFDKLRGVLFCFGRHEAFLFCLLQLGHLLYLVFIREAAVILYYYDYAYYTI